MADQALLSKIVEFLQMRGKFEIQLVGVIPLDGLPTSNLFYKRPDWYEVSRLIYYVSITRRLKNG